MRRDTDETKVKGKGEQTRREVKQKERKQHSQQKSAHLTSGLQVFLSNFTVGNNRVTEPQWRLVAQKDKSTSSQKKKQLQNQNWSFAVKLGIS